MTTAPRLLATVLLATAALMPLPLRAHEGHDHDAPPPPVAQALAPRVEANTSEVQLLAVLQGERLIVHLDRYASNEPINDARLEAESGTFKALAQQVGEGSYALPVGPLVQPGKHPLVFSVEAGELTDLLSATLEVAAPVAAPSGASGSSWSAGALAAAGGVIVLLGGVLLLRRRHPGEKR